MSKRIVVLFLLLSLAGIAVAEEEGPFSDWVAAQWTNGAWYLAKISATDGDRISVDYADGDKGIVAPGQIRRLLARMPVTVGQSVLAVWKNKRFYPGKVSEIRDDGVLVAWDDGDEPLLVPHGQLMAP